MNAKKEFIEHVNENPVKCAMICCEKDWDYDTEIESYTKEVFLKRNHTSKELEDFLNKLDFNYDSGYGLQVLYGVIWYNDGTCSERGEYDGSEWWEHRITPAIPEIL